MSKTFFFVEDFQLNFETIFLSSAPPKVDPIHELYLCKAWRHNFSVKYIFLTEIEEKI